MKYAIHLKNERNENLYLKENGWITALPCWFNSKEEALDVLCGTAFLTRTFYLLYDDGYEEEINLFANQRPEIVRFLEKQLKRASILKKYTKVTYREIDEGDYAEINGQWCPYNEFDLLREWVK